MCVRRYRRDESSGVVHKIFSNLRGKNIEVSLEKQIDIVRVLECKIGQASLLAHPDFATLKGFKMHLDMLRIRFGLTLSVHEPSFYLKKSINTLEYHTKQKIATQHQKPSASNTEDKILQNIKTSISRKETLFKNSQ